MQPDLQKKLFAEINGYIDENSTRLAERALSPVLGKSLIGERLFRARRLRGTHPRRAAGGR